MRYEGKEFKYIQNLGINGDADNFDRISDSQKRKMIKSENLRREFTVFVYFPMFHRTSKSNSNLNYKCGAALTYFVGYKTILWCWR